jgi:hypothetical protein
LLGITPSFIKTSYVCVIEQSIARNFSISVGKLATSKRKTLDFRAFSIAIIGIYQHLLRSYLRCASASFRL